MNVFFSPVGRLPDSDKLAEFWCTLLLVSSLLVPDPWRVLPAFPLYRLFLRTQNQTRSSAFSFLVFTPRMPLSSAFLSDLSPSLDQNAPGELSLGDIDQPPH